MSQQKQTIALHEPSNRMIDIADAQNGLKCECVCTCCGDRLVAKQGIINQWSFAHESGADCAGAVESALHKAAKQVILDESALNLPELPEFIRFTRKTSGFSPVM